MRTAYPICSMPGCEQQIYLRPHERDVCEACRLRGGPPPAPLPQADDRPIEIPAHIVCARPDCSRFIVDFDNSGRRECLMHHRETTAALNP
ncbi:MAG: hypothetical protein ACRDQB_09315 [Thermocrispum sp.]